MKALLDKLKEIKPYLTSEQCDVKFQELAQLLLDYYAIQNKDNIYRLTDIEFYYYDPYIHDERIKQEHRKVTYERTTPVGSWFFHDSGIDLSFESEKDKGYGGGILIRGIKKIAPKDDKTISGSLNTYWTLFDEYVSAFESSAPNPHLIPFKFASFPKIKNDLRKGLTNVEKHPRKWRYFIELK